MVCMVLFCSKSGIYPEIELFHNPVPKAELQHYQLIL